MEGRELTPDDSDRSLVLLEAELGLTSVKGAASILTRNWHESILFVLTVNLARPKHSLRSAESDPKK